MFLGLAIWFGWIAASSVLAKKVSHRYKQAEELERGKAQGQYSTRRWFCWALFETEELDVMLGINTCPPGNAAPQRAR